MESAMATTDFFATQTPQSRTKATIVSKYFDAWANVLSGHARSRGDGLQYIDLYAGPGRYKDRSESTPLLVLKKAIANPKLHDQLHCIFNDAKKAHARQLKREIDALPGIDKLRYAPKVYCRPVDDAVAE